MLPDIHAKTLSFSIQRWMGTVEKQRMNRPSLSFTWRGFRAHLGTILGLQKDESIFTKLSSRPLSTIPVNNGTILVCHRSSGASSKILTGTDEDISENIVVAMGQTTNISIYGSQRREHVTH